jgi:hypothetical protein
MPQVVGVFVTTEAVTVNIVSVRVDDFVIAHVVAPIGGRTVFINPNPNTKLQPSF